MTEERHREITETSTTDPERYRRTLARGILVFRWVWLGWMVALAASAADELRIAGLAWASIGAAGAWTVWLTATRDQWTGPVLAFDLGLCVYLVVVSGLVVPEGDVVSGRPFFATGYPLSAALAWGAARGPLKGLGAGVVLGVAHLLSRPINGVSFADLSLTQLQNVTGAFLNYIVAAGAIGIVSRVLVRSARQVDEAQRGLMAERERSARLAERENLARQIHDSVLQALALVHKRGRELSARADIPGNEVARLAEIAGKQEEELRSLILREPENAPTGTVSLRQRLESGARATEGVDVAVSSVGPIWMDRSTADEVSAAVRQALENVARHSGARAATVFAEEDDGSIVVTVRDDGEGFEYDETQLRAKGKVGILKSIKGRAEALGGAATVASSPGHGTEIELRIPAEAGEKK